MSLDNNYLALFNATMLRNKREVLLSIEDYLAHHQEENNGESYCAEKRGVILNICQKFLEAVQKTEIPQLIKPFHCYTYSLTHAGMSLSRLVYTDVSFDEDGMFEGGEIIDETSILNIQCDYLSVEEYAKLYQVTDITVRQWIRRGKLRTAKKNGREWCIPALSNPPKRGYESATYFWESIPEGVISLYPDFPMNGYAEFFQDTNNKKMFVMILNSSTGESKRFELTVEEREQIELLLITSDLVRVELLSDKIMYVPSKRESSIPYLQTEKTFSKDAQIFVKCLPEGPISFQVNSEYGDSCESGDPSNYILPIRWEFYNAGDSDDAINAAFEGNYKHSQNIGVLYGSLILCEEMIENGWDTEEFCDDEDADLGMLMRELNSEFGPLNECNGGFGENVLYIHELEMAEGMEESQFAYRIMQEVPWICKRNFHIFPEIIAYIVGYRGEPEILEANRRFYEENGFCQVGDTRVMYAYTE